MSDGVHAGVDAKQAPRPHLSIDPRAGPPFSQQLHTGDDTVLPIGNGHFSSHTDEK
jgi:hypothetical protein